MIQIFRFFLANLRSLFSADKDNVKMNKSFSDRKTKRDKLSVLLHFFFFFQEKKICI